MASARNWPGSHQKILLSWIKNFIRDPKKIIESGDTTAQKLFNKYKTLMPSFAYLPDEEINAIVAFIHSKKKPGKHRKAGRYQ